MRRLLLALALWQVAGRVAPEPRHFQLERAVEVPAGAMGPVCAALDADVFAHSAGLADVRLVAAGHEVPYALTMSQSGATTDDAPILNRGERSGKIVFDLKMPPRAYTSVMLKLAGQDFLATAKVSGMGAPGEAGTELGTFTLFDLTGQRLGRSTSIALPESTFPWLHVELEAKAAPGHAGFQVSPAMLESASVPPSREAQTVYTTVAETANIRQAGRESVAEFEVSARVPVERVRFSMEPGDKANFSRTVEIRALAKGNPHPRPGWDEMGGVETASGEISRVKMLEGGTEIREEQLAVTATLGSTGESPATVTVAVENEDDQPLPIRAVALEMRERKLCFDGAGGLVTMYYGDPALPAPVYDYARLFRASAEAADARLGAETANAGFVAREQPAKPLTERHPEILWVALLGVVAALGGVAFRSAKRI